MAITVRVHINRGRIKTLSSATKTAIAMTAEQLRTEMIQENVMPFDEGTLQNVQTYIDTQALGRGEVKIVHDTPYARRLYYHPEYNFSTDTNANAGGEWWEPWLTGDKKDRPLRLFRKFYKKLTGVD